MRKWRRDLACGDARCQTGRSNPPIRADASDHSVPRPNSRCANVGCGLPIIEEEVLALHGPGRAPREIAVLTRLAGGRDCRRQPPPWRHHHHPAFLVIRDATIKETIGALYKRLGEQVAPRYRSGEPARQIKDDVDIGAGLTARRNHGWAELHQFAGVLIQVEARRGVPPSQRRNTEVRLTHRWRNEIRTSGPASRAMASGRDQARGRTAPTFCYAWFEPIGTEAVERS